MKTIRTPRLVRIVHRNEHPIDAYLPWSGVWAALMLLVWATLVFAVCLGLGLALPIWMGGVR